MTPTPGALVAMLDRKLLADANVHVLAHARDRMDEMGVPVTALLDMLDRPSVDRPAGDRRIAVSERWPSWAAVYERRADGRRVVATVLFREMEEYERDGDRPVPIG